MAAIRTITWSHLPPSEDPDAQVPTMSLVPASPPSSRPSSPSNSYPPSDNIPPLSSSPAEAPLSSLTSVSAISSPSFPHFSSLPREIQFLIWDLAISSVGAAEKYEPYQLLIPAWKYFSTQPWHKGLSCCVPKQKVLCGMMGGTRRRGVENVVALNREGGVGGRTGEDLRCIQAGVGKGRCDIDDEEVKRSAHPHIHAERCGKTIYLSPGWARSGLGSIANSCLTGRWLALGYMKNGLEAFESECLEVQKRHVFAVLEEMVEEMDGRLRGW